MNTIRHFATPRLAARLEAVLCVASALAVLLQAKARGLIRLLAPVLERLRRETSFRFSAELEREILRRAGKA